MISGALSGCRCRLETTMHCDSFNSALSLDREQVLVTRFSTWGGYIENGRVIRHRKTRLADGCTPANDCVSIVLYVAVSTSRQPSLGDREPPSAKHCRSRTALTRLSHIIAPGPPISNCLNRYSSFQMPSIHFERFLTTRAVNNKLGPFISNNYVLGVRSNHDMKKTM